MIPELLGSQLVVHVERGDALEQLYHSHSPTIGFPSLLHKLWEAGVGTCRPFEEVQCT